jgi:hypothetical protein
VLPQSRVVKASPELFALRLGLLLKLHALMLTRLRRYLTKHLTRWRDNRGSNNVLENHQTASGIL